MIEILIQLAILIVGFLLLMKGADWFVDGAVEVAARFGIPQIVIGLTVVAIGTSLPEASVSIASALKGNAGITIGNVLGSNIMNVFLILGITSLICRIPVGKMTKKYDLPLVIMATAALAAMGLYDNKVDRIEGLALLAVMVAYLLHLVYRASKDREDEVEDLEMISAPEKDGDASAKAPMAAWKMIALIILGLAMISFGSDITVDAATEIATIIGIDQRIIGLTIVAFGTSLPELVTSVTAAVKGNTDIAIGNIVGSNLFNILFVTGIAAVITPITYKSDFMLDSTVALFAVVLLYVCILPKQRLNRLTGVIMVLCYGGYLTAMLMM